MRVLVYAHFDNIGVLRQDIINFLKDVQAVYEKIYFVTTRLNDAELWKLPSRITIISRENYGYDFYSYRAGLIQFLKTNFININEGHLTFLNSSIIILYPEKLIEHLNKSFGNDNVVFGLTLSYEITPHIQSYMVTVPFKLLRNKSFLSWWQHMEPLNNKRQIIEQYEIGLSVLITDIGYIIRSTYKPSWFIKSKKTKNVCFSQPERLLRHTGCIKVQLIRDNPHNRNLTQILKHFEQSQTNNTILEHVLTS